MFKMLTNAYVGYFLDTGSSSQACHQHKLYLISVINIYVVLLYISRDPNWAVQYTQSDRPMDRAHIYASLSLFYVSHGLKQCLKGLYPVSNF